MRAKGWVCNSSAGRRGRDGLIPRASWLAHLVKLARPRLSERLSQNIRWRAIKRGIPDVNLWSLWVLAPAHVERTGLSLGAPHPLDGTLVTRLNLFYKKRMVVPGCGG